MSAVQLRRASDAALEGAALNDAQHRALFDPSPECDSLAERIVALRHHGVPIDILRGLLGDVRAVLELNALEGDCHRRINGDLDGLLAGLDAGAKLTDAITVRALVRRLRDPLSTLLTPEQATAAELVSSRDVVRSIISTTPVEKLRSQTLAHELGGRRHRLLLQLAGGSRS